MYGDWDDEVKSCVNFSHEEVQVMAIPPDDHDTKYIMSSAVILEDHYENRYDPPDEEIGIAMYLERKAFELDSDRSNYEAENCSSDESTDSLLQPLSHSAITELQGEAPVVCFDSDREGQEVHEWKEYELSTSKFCPFIKNTHKICVTRIEYTPNRKGCSRFWTDTDEEIENESLDEEVCITGTNHNSNKEWIHVDQIKKRYCFTNKGTRCKS